MESILFLKSLYKIIELQKHLHKDGLLDHGDLLGYYFSHEGLDSRYLNTPLDVISFATPGSDGIHYGFLTDFGQVEDLEKAYIVRVSPMDFDEPVKIIARNIDDFMRILCFSPIVLDLVDISTSESDFEKWLKNTRSYPLINILMLGEIKLEKFFVKHSNLNQLSLYVIICKKLSVKGKMRLFYLLQMV